MPEIKQADREAAKEALLVRNLFGREQTYEETAGCLAAAFAAHREAAVDAYIATATPPEPRELTAEVEKLTTERDEWKQKYQDLLEEYDRVNEGI
jgi:hypothetical protein